MYLKLFTTFGLLAVMTMPAAASIQLDVTVTSNVPNGGVALTPVWVGFHDGSFDSYNGGLSSQVGLERLAEDGNSSVLSADFQAGYTYVDNASGTPVSARVQSSQSGSRVDGSIASAAGPIFADGQGSGQFMIETDGSNRYFSYASMVLPSNDYFVGNGNPFAIDLMSLYDGEGTIEFQIGLPGTINDAGTEVNDFASSAANGAFGLPPGQSGPNQGTDENGVNKNVTNAFGNFLNADGLDLDGFDFNSYPNGIATVTISASSGAVPEPATFVIWAAFAAIGCVCAIRNKS